MREKAPPSCFFLPLIFASSLGSLLLGLAVASASLVLPFSPSPEALSPFFFVSEVSTVDSHPLPPDQPGPCPPFEESSLTFTQFAWTGALGVFPSHSSDANVTILRGKFPGETDPSLRRA